MANAFGSVFYKISSLTARERIEGCLFHIRLRSKLNVCGWYEESDKFWTDEKNAFKWETQIDKLNRKTAVRVAHLMSVPWVWRIPLMLWEILKSVGGHVDKLWTCTEYKFLHPEQNIQQQLIYIDLSNWKLWVLEYIPLTAPIWAL